MAKVRILRLPESTSTDDRAVSVPFWNRITHGGSSTSSGEFIDDKSALRAGPFWGCVRLISSNISTLPMDFYQRVDRVKIPHRPRPEWMNFNFGAWNRVTLMQSAQVSLLTEGNAHWATTRDPEGNIIALDLLDPHKVEPFFSDVTGQMHYRVSTRNGIVTVGRMEITHIPGMMLPGAVKGLSPVTYARETIGLSLGLDSYGGSFFKNGARPLLGIEMPGEPDQVAIEILRDSFNQQHQGAGNAHKIAILSADAKFRELSINPVDAEYLNQRKLQTPQICQIFGVPPARLGYADAPMLGRSLEEQNTAYVSDVLLGWADAHGEGLSDAQRLSGSTPADSFVQFDLNALMRGDYTSRIGTNVQAVREGILTPNEAREMEGLPPVPWGDRPVSVQVQEGIPGDDPPVGET